MLKIYFGDHENEIYNPPAYFLNQYEEEWITRDLSKEMILDVDKSTVLAPRIIDSPVLGAITPRELSGGVKTLILMAYDDSGKVFNASACGDNCAKWIQKISRDRDLTVSLHHIMHFEDDFEAEILNDASTVRSVREYVLKAVTLI